MCDMKGGSSANTLGRLNVTVGSDLSAGAKYLSKMSILQNVNSASHDVTKLVWEKLQVIKLLLYKCFL